MRTILTGGVILTPDIALQDHCIIIRGEMIEAIIPDRDYIQDTDDIHISCDKNLITPGLVDIHIHGSNHADTMDASHESFEKIGQFIARHGVTNYLLTTGAASSKQIDKVIQAFISYQPSREAAGLLGIHLEGPYLDYRNRGAQPERYLRLPSEDEYLPWFKSGAVRLMTVAPELEGASEMIRIGRSLGVQFAAGHTSASFEEMQNAVDCGLNQTTHTFNGMDSLHHRKPGVLGAALSDGRVFTQLIADGVHVHPAVARILTRTKGPERTVLITDAMRAAGLPDGKYDLLGQEIIVVDQVARTDAGGLAGSVLTMDAAVRNVMSFCGLSFEDAIRMACFTPADSLGLSGQLGKLKPGIKANLVIFSSTYRVEATMINGLLIENRN